MNVTTGARSFPAPPFIRASSLHIGAAAATASLRHELVDHGRMSAAEFDKAFAVARLTPGTNLLAMYTLLGQHFDGVRGGVFALALGTLIPSVLIIALGALYVHFRSHPAAAGVIQGAQTGGLAVFLWAVVQLSRPQLNRYGLRGASIAASALVGIVVFHLPQFVSLLVAGGLGAILLREPS